MNTEQELMLFQFDLEEVRVIKDDNGELWFIAKDVCNILGHTNPTMATNNLDDDEKGLRKVSTFKGEQLLLAVTESGLYALIIRSNKPNAKKFRKWITSEVLPQIRKTGRYAINNQSPIPELFVQIANLQKQLKEAEPKVEAYDAFMNAGDGISLTEAAQKISVKPTKFHNFIINNGYCRDTKNWDYRPYQKYIDTGYFKARILHSGNTQTLVLPEGINYFSQESIKEQIEKESERRRYSQPTKVTVNDIIESTAQKILDSLSIPT